MSRRACCARLPASWSVPMTSRRGCAPPWERSARRKTGKLASGGRNCTALVGKGAVWVGDLSAHDTQGWAKTAHLLQKPDLHFLFGQQPHRHGPGAPDVARVLTDGAI